MKQYKFLYAKLARHKLIFKNIGYLSILQGINLIVPLITLPYLIRTLGAELYGKIAFAQAVASYLVILVSFGFSVTGVQEVSVNRKDKDRLSEIVSAIYTIKVILLAGSVLTIWILAQFFNSFQGNFLLICLSMWVCLYDALFPEWYFQGLERMKIVTFTTSLFRTIFLALIFLLVKNEQDFLLVPIINGIGALISGIIGMYIVFVRHRVKFTILDFSTILKYLRESFPIFLYKSTQLYIKLNKVFVGMFIGMTAVAYYDIAEKIVTVLKMPVSIISQTIFPKNVREKNISFIIRTFLSVLILCCLIILILLATAEQLAAFIGGKEMFAAAPIVRLLSWTLIPVSFNSVFASQLLFSYGLKKQYMWSIVFAGLTYLTLVGGMHLTEYWTLLGIGWAVLIAESVTSVASLLFIKKSSIFSR